MRGMKITLLLTVDGDYFEATVDWPAVPRQGDLVHVADPESGWNEEVYRVWWDMPNGDASIEFRDIKDGHGEGLADSLLAAGWRRP
jgi:hypothetical protein